MYSTLFITVLLTAVVLRSFLVFLFRQGALARRRSRGSGSRQQTQWIALAGVVGTATRIAKAPFAPACADGRDDLDFAPPVHFQNGLRV